jgi:hypothetical protein
MTCTDRQTARLMLKDAEKSVAEVTADMKASVGPVKTRLDGMMAASAIFIMPIIDQARSSGIACQVTIEAEEWRRPEVDRLVTAKIKNLIRRPTSATPCPSASRGGTSSMRRNSSNGLLRRQRGVGSVRMSIFEQVVYIFGWLEKAVAAAGRCRQRAS